MSADAAIPCVIYAAKSTEDKRGSIPEHWVRATSDPHIAHLGHLFLRPAYWGSGLAAQLLTRATQSARARGLELMRLFVPVGQARANRRTPPDHLSLGGSSEMASETLEQITAAVESRRMYAIAFDLETAALEEHHPASGDSWKKAYREIKGALEVHGFEPQQGSVYFGDENVTSVTCVLAVQDLAAKFDWFSESVRDIRMLRIEEHNDLSVAIPAKV